MAKLDALRALIVVARYGNLRDAAHELGRTQSALSMALSQLEHSLGGPLFMSDRKRSLTDLGQFVHDAASDLIREHDRVQDLIYGYARGDAGHLRIASVPSVAVLILPDILRDFMDLHPGARISLTDSDSTNVHKMIAAGHADIGIAGPAPAGAPLREEHLFNDAMYVVCPATSPLAALPASLGWDDIAQSTLIANEALAGFDHPVVQDALNRSKLSVRNVSSLLAMVASGMGITVLPGLATRNLPPNLMAIPLKGANSDRTINMLTHPSRAASPLAGGFSTFFKSRVVETGAR